MAVVGATNLWLYLFSLLSLSFLRLNTAVTLFLWEFISCLKGDTLLQGYLKGMAAETRTHLHIWNQVGLSQDHCDQQEKRQLILWKAMCTCMCIDAVQATSVFLPMVWRQVCSHWRRVWRHRLQDLDVYICGQLSSDPGMKFQIPGALPVIKGTRRPILKCHCEGLASGYVCRRPAFGSASAMSSRFPPKPAHDEVGLWPLAYAGARTLQGHKDLGTSLFALPLGATPWTLK